ncbi:hypothetical protein OG871_40205 (plasmid) [Kitasatospora sp. NBC_00374]|uniref:hypothetical protein n=1 Tax=Kitasatospora sp. NBC_00374 TaxID=2975964 RepID=UPI002F917D4B
MLSTKKTTKLIASAVAAAAVIAGAAGCSSDGKKAGGDITGAQSTSPTASASASASPTPTSAPGAPAITLPADVAVDIQFKAGDDPVKKQAADGLTYALRAFTEAAATGDINRPGMVYAFTGTAGAYMNQALTQLNSRGQTITGTDRYYALTVDLKDPKTAVTAYCEDQSKSFAKDKASGKVLTTTPSINDYTDWTTALTLSDKGVWQVSSTQAEKGSTRCQSASTS